MAPSINRRLLTSLTLFVVLALGLSGYALDHSFRSSAETALTEKLKAHFYSLLAATDDKDGKLVMPESLSDPLFNQIGSGLYAIIINQKQQETWRSSSAISLNLPEAPKPSTGQFHFQHLQSETDNPLFLLSYGIIWEPEEGLESHYQIYLLQSTLPMQAEISQFRGSLWRWFSAIAVILIALQSIIMRWGLSPLRQLASELDDIESGKKEQLNGRYPSELEGVTHNLNILIENERRQRQRYRDSLADLAHSLKTPLAILRGLRFNTTSSQAIAENQQNLAEQVTRMDEIVSHQLQRANAKTVASNTLSMPAVTLAPLAEKLLRTLNKVYADKGIETNCTIAADLCYCADERDLMEILGNLLDNAFKASRSNVSVSASTHNQWLTITIDDNGDGIPIELRNTVLNRGNRADTQHPGQGLGLTVANDIIKNYRGELTLEDSELGGARVRIELPLS